jgi:hypothetical protein
MLRTVGKEELGPEWLQFHFIPHPALRGTGINEATRRRGFRTIVERAKARLQTPRFFDPAVSEPLLDALVRAHLQGKTFEPVRGGIDAVGWVPEIGLLAQRTRRNVVVFNATRMNQIAQRAERGRLWVGAPGAFDIAFLALAINIPFGLQRKKQLGKVTRYFADEPAPPGPVSVELFAQEYAKRMGLAPADQQYLIRRVLAFYRGLFNKEIRFASVEPRRVAGETLRAFRERIIHNSPEGPWMKIGGMERRLDKKEYYLEPTDYNI